MDSLHAFKCKRFRNTCHTAIWNTTTTTTTTLWPESASEYRPSMSYSEEAVFSVRCQRKFYILHGLTTPIQHTCFTPSPVQRIPASLPPQRPGTNDIQIFSANKSRPSVWLKERNTVLLKNKTKRIQHEKHFQSFCPKFIADHRTSWSYRTKMTPVPAAYTCQYASTWLISPPKTR
jgi:hypothetical protein